jgi:cytochrome P450
MRDVTREVARDTAPPGRHWMGPGELVLRTWRARRHGDAGDILRAVARGGHGAVGLRLRGRRILLLLDPGLAGELLSGHAASTVKGPGLQRARSMLGDGLLTSEGAAHDRARRLVAPAFSPRRLAGYAAIFARCTRECTAAWTNGDRRDMHAEMTALTLRIAGQALMGLDLAEESPRVRSALNAALADFAAGGAFPALGSARARRRLAGPTPGGTVPGAPPGAALHQLVDDIIEQRRAASPGDGADVISALLTASEEPGGLTAGEVHDHVITLLLAAHETTASALTFTLYLLGRHPEAQRRVQAEADSLGGREAGPGDLPALAYTRAAISEAIRLYPPAWIIGRAVTAGTTLGGWHLPPGSLAGVSPLLLHRDPRWYPGPDEFDPARWLGQAPQARPRDAFLPFGTGPRACIGEQFAWNEAIIVLATLARSWSFSTAPGFRPTVSYRITLRPAAGMPMTVTARR